QEENPHQDGCFWCERGVSMGTRENRGVIVEPDCGKVGELWMMRHVDGEDHLVSYTFTSRTGRSGTALFTERRADIAVVWPELDDHRRKDQLTPGPEGLLLPLHNQLLEAPGYALWPRHQT